MKTFLLGTGCQKGGTTWLHDYLRQSSQYVHGYRKEYHVFDGLDLPTEKRHRTRVVRLATEALEAIRRNEPVDAGALHRASMYADTTMYFDYFAGLLGQADDARLATDMTPSYSMLSSGRLSMIRDAFAERGVRVATVFLLRDPVERLWSQLRMHERMFPGILAAPSEQVLLENYHEPQYALRTRYDLTIRRLDAVFEPEDVHYAWYESLFREAEIRSICTLLGIDFHPPAFERRVHASPKGTRALSEDTVRTVATHFREVYEFVSSRFPDVDLEALWPSTRYLE